MSCWGERERERSTQGDHVLFSSLGLWEGFLGQGLQLGQQLCPAWQTFETGQSTACARLLHAGGHAGGLLQPAAATVPCCSRRRLHTAAHTYREAALLLFGGSREVAGHYHQNSGIQGGCFIRLLGKGYILKGRGWNSTTADGGMGGTQGEQ